MLLSPQVLILGVAVGLLSSVIPYSLELTALRRITPRLFGILMSLEPAAAALAGDDRAARVADARPSGWPWSAWSTASVGATRTSPPPLDEPTPGLSRLLSLSVTGRSELSGRGRSRRRRPRPGRGRRWRPPRPSLSSKSKMSRFSAIRPGFADFGIATRPSWTCQRSTTWVADLPYFSPIPTTTGSERRSSPGAADRAPRLGDDAVLGVEGAARVAGAVRAELDLVHVRRHPGLLDHLAQVGRLEVGDADGLDRPLVQQRGQPAHRVDEPVLVRVGPVHHQQVDVVDAEPLADWPRTPAGRRRRCATPG